MKYKKEQNLEQTNPCHKVDISKGQINCTRRVDLLRVQKMSKHAFNASGGSVLRLSVRVATTIKSNS